MGGTGAFDDEGEALGVTEEKRRKTSSNDVSYQGMTYYGRITV